MSEENNHSEGQRTEDQKTEDTQTVENTAPESEVKDPKAELSSACKTALEGKTFQPHEALAILMSSLADFNSVMEKSPNLNYTADEAGRDWMGLVAQGAVHYARGGTFASSVERDGSQWKQFVDNDGDKIGASRPRTESPKDGEVTKLSGDRAIFKLTSSLGLGTVVQIPLWHSGIWITLRAPSDSALLELERRIAAEKIELGRHTNGMVFSNSSVYIVSHLVNFILAHVYDSSLKTNSKKNLKRSIMVTDLPLLVWGMVCSIYPNGYNFSQPCTANPDKCQHFTNELLNISKLCWTDNSALSTKQRNHMAKRSDKYQHEDLIRYREEHVHGQPRTVKINDVLSVKLRVPNLEEYETSGFKWVDGITRMVEESFAVDLKGNERNDYINEQARATALRQYAHWISEIRLEDGTVIEDADTLDESMSRLSIESEISKKLFTEINTYIDDSTVSLIALPQYNCPACGEKQSETHARYPHLIPLGVSQIFFTLLDQRIVRILNDLE